jgi:hypothetical protein
MKNDKLSPLRDGVETIALEIKCLGYPTELVSRHAFRM